MKKLLCIILVFFLVMPSAFTFAQTNADDSELQTEQIFSTAGFVLSDATCNFGSFATVDVKTTAGFSFAAAVINLNYDAGALRLIGVSSDFFEYDFTLNDKGAVLALFDLDNATAYTGAVATLKFESINKSGEFEVSGTIEQGGVSSAQGYAVDAVVKSGVITVNCEHYYIYKHTVESTCSKNGEIVYVCCLCNSERITYLDKTQHTEGEWKTVKQPDCTNKGKRQLYCQVCREVLKTEEISAVGHVFGEELVDVAATCTKDGMSVKFCSVCNYEEYTVIKAKRHASASWVSSAPSGCEEAGTVSLVCDYCSEVLETEETQVNGHLMDWIVKTPATCSENGEKAYLCLICGKTEQTEQIQKLEHTTGEEIILNASTCTKKGLAEVHCAVCNRVIETKELDFAKHTKRTMTVITAPSDKTTGTAVYKCQVCKQDIESLTLPKTDASIFGTDIQVYSSATVRVAVSTKNNKGFAAGLLKITYNEKALIFLGTEAAKVTDLTVAKSKSGEINVLMCPDVGDVLGDGELFYLVFELTNDAETSDVNITYEPNGGFSDKNGNYMFFNVSGCTVTVNEYMRGDVNRDGLINTTDLAIIKKQVAGLEETESSADINCDGVVNTSDLALLKKYVAGLITSFFAKKI